MIHSIYIHSRIDFGKYKCIYEMLGSQGGMNIYVRLGILVHGQRSL